ncbi:hypothetical protein [Chitinimonas sp.]|uniref:hypothetical protein n=1 Tax=Chitinimonas sp. TaxID=1934313 RepID=UPI002F9580DB
MGTSGIGASNPQRFQSSNNGNPRAQAFKSLADALKSGDVSAAQQAYAKLKDAKQVQGAQGDNTDFSTLGQALQNGDLSGAQAAFDKLKTDAQAERGERHHRHKRTAAEGGGDAAAGSRGNGSISIKA